MESFSEHQSTLHWTIVINLLIYLFVQKGNCSDSEVMMMNGKDVEQVIYLLSKEKKSCSAECECAAFLKIALMSKEDEKFTKLII